MKRTIPYHPSTHHPALKLHVPDPPQPSDTATGDSAHQTITSPRTVSAPPSTPRPHQFPFPRPLSTPAFPPTPPTRLTGPLFPPPRVQAPRPRPPLSHPRATGPPPHNPYAPRPRPRQPLSSRDHRTSRTTRTRQFDRRRSHPRSRSAHSRRPREHRRRSPAASRSRRNNRPSRRSHSRHHRSRILERLGNCTLHRSVIAPPISPQHVHDRVIPAPIVADHGQAITLLAQHLELLHAAHPFRPLYPFNLPLIGTLRWRPLWYYYLDPAIDYTHNPPLQVPPPSHDLPLHLKHFNHLLLFHHSAPSPLPRLRNFDNFAFNFNNNNNNKLLITFSNKLSSTPRSIHSFPHSSFTFHHPLCPSPQPHLPIRHRALHQSLHRHQNQHQLHRNLPTFPFPSSHLSHPGGIDPSISRSFAATRDPPTIVSPMVSAQT